MSTDTMLMWLYIALIGIFAGAAFTLVQWVVLYGQTIHV